MYSARNLEMTIRFFLYNLGSLNDFIGQKCLKLKLRSAFVPSYQREVDVGLQWYQWIPDFYNIRFEQNNLTEKNYVQVHDHYGHENF